MAWTWRSPSATATAAGANMGQSFKSLVKPKREVFEEWALEEDVDDLPQEVYTESIKEYLDDARSTERD